MPIYALVRWFPSPVNALEGVKLTWSVHLKDKIKGQPKLKVSRMRNLPTTIRDSLYRISRIYDFSHFYNLKSISPYCGIYALENRVKIDSDNESIRRQAIIWTNAGILLIEPLETKFREP